MLKKLELHGFKSFDKKTHFDLSGRVSAIVGPNGSGKSNVAEALRWVLGEQSLKSVRGKRGEDLIFNGSKLVAKQNRASVAIHFDNSAKRLPVDFETVIISREVYRDGENRYLINNTQVRLKDVLELLSSVGVGGSSHHIISQGEADRILMAKSDARREMIEEALGLAVYQWKRAESERKLEKTIENIKEANYQRREIAPQLKALAAEIEKLNRYDAVRDELTAAYVEYFAYGFAMIAKKRAVLVDEVNFYQEKLTEYEQDVPNVGEQLRTVRIRTEEATRALGRVEGALDAAQAIADREEAHEEISVVHEVAGVRVCLACGQTLPEGESSEHLPVSRAVLPAREQIDTEPLLAQKAELEQRIVSLRANEAQLHEEEKVVRQFYTQKAELKRILEDKRNTLDRVMVRDVALREDLKDALERAGRPVMDFERMRIEEGDPKMSLDLHEERRVRIERLKIRLEEVGGADQDSRTQYKDLLAREQYILSEINDLKTSAEQLEGLMLELSERVDREFREGIAKINEKYQEFFTMLFGGGTAGLEPVTLSAPDEPTVYGLDIAITMPHKKVKGLHMLSGGERALASIALVFALSQVNPPPFLVLDETDAALDESNSRRYGEMISRLADHSQLVIITHNRETMARAHSLYGVTMGEDGTSRVLSVKLEGR